MKKVTKKVVKDIIEILKNEIEETKEAALDDDNSLYGKYIAKAESALSTLQCVIESGYPIKSKKVQDIVAAYRR